MAFRKYCLAFAIWCAAVSTGQAAVLTSTGATGVEVNGTFYDVVFEDGTCVALFDGCDESSDFVFKTWEDAELASLALLALFNSSGNETFTNDPNSTAGCSNTPACIIQTPYEYSDYTAWTYAFRNCAIDAPACLDMVSDYARDPTGDSGVIVNGADNQVWAIWTTTTVTAVPLPASLPLMAIGLAGLGVLRRRRMRKVV